MTEPTPDRNEFFTGLTVALLFIGGTVAAIIAAIQGSLWWLALPVVVAGLLWWITRPRRRDEQLAQVIGLDELPDVDTVDRELLDPATWEHALWVDLDEEGERR